MSELYQQKSKKTGGTNVKLFPGKEDTETLSWLQTRWTDMDSAREDGSWGLRWDQDRSKTTFNLDGTANVNLPLERSTRRLKKADEEAIKPSFDFIPTEKSDIDKVSLTKVVFDFAWGEAEVPFYLSQGRDIKHIFGTVFMNVFLKQEIENKFLLSGQDKEGNPIGTKNLVKKNWIATRAVDPRNFWHDNVHNWEDATDCFERREDIDEETLKSLKSNPAYKNIDEALKSHEEGQENARGKPFFTENERTQKNSQQERKKFTIWRYTNKIKGVYIESVDFNVLIRESVNPNPDGSLGYEPWVDEDKPLSVTGIGIPEQVESQKYQANELVNQILDLVRATSTNYLIVGKDTAVEENETDSGILKVLNVDGGNFQFATPPQSDKGLINILNSIMEQATWITGVDVRSIVGDAARTLGQEQIREVNRLKSISNSIRNFEYFLRRYAKLLLSYIQYYLPSTTGRKILGAEGKPRTINLIDTKIENITRPNKEDGKAEIIGKKAVKKQGEFDFLELTSDMINSNLDIQVETPFTTPVLREIEKVNRQEARKKIIENAQIDPKLLEKIDLTAVVKDDLEDVGVDASKYFNEEEDSIRKQQDLRQSVMENIPLPPQPSEQPKRNINVDTLLQSAEEAPAAAPTP